MKTAQLAQAFETVSNMREPLARMASSDLLNEKGQRVLYLYDRTLDALNAYNTVSALMDESSIGERLGVDAEDITEARILYNYLVGMADLEDEPTKSFEGGFIYYKDSDGVEFSEEDLKILNAQVGQAKEKLNQKYGKEGQ